MSLRIVTDRLPLTLEQPFSISHGTSLVRENVLVRLHDGDLCGLGEAAVVPYYDTTVEQVLAYLHDPALERLLNAGWSEAGDLSRSLPRRGPPAARAAIDMAIFDLWAQRLGAPLYQLWGLEPSRCPNSSFTVAMTGDEASYRANLQAARGFDLIKLKLGSGDMGEDMERLRIAREVLGCSFALDANGGWSVDEAAAFIPRLMAPDVVFVEEPVSGAGEGASPWRALRSALPANAPPIIADEAVQDLEGLERLEGLVDGVNIKLSKCGGLEPALGMIKRAREHGLRVLIGCMIESSVAVTAAAHLAPLADFVDLDGHLLVRDDPFCGVTISRELGGQVSLPGRPGVGVFEPVQRPRRGQTCS